MRSVRPILKTLLLLAPLTLGAARAGGGAAPPAAPTMNPASAVQPARPAGSAVSLRALADARGLLLGAAVNPTLFDPNEPDYALTLNRHFNAVVAENAMKWAGLHNNREAFAFGFADAIVNAAVKNGQTVRGHTLVWHDSLPPWVYTIQTREELLRAMQDHITGVVTHFRDRVHIWDVVNEAVSDAPGHPLRPSPFLNLIGPDFIDEAFRAAHAADPGAKLYYNDYNTDGLNGKSDAVYELVRGMLARGVPIHGVGFQAHLNTDFDVTGAQVQANLQRFRDLGLDVQMTEVDVQLRPARPEADELARQAAVYRDLLRTCLNVRCAGFITWGVTDFNSWRAAGRPLIFDDVYAPKPAFAAVAQELRK
ncbi:endo-1,4-beta-xylanase [Deinococcus sp. A31D244]|uniref:endo-1,4-beta-xylanase n=1 Tax=Deinococcus sp. A31D244 TaxID=3397675 RepID=UPI0039E103DC